MAVRFYDDIYDLRAQAANLALPSVGEVTVDKTEMSEYLRSLENLKKICL